MLVVGVFAMLLHLLAGTGLVRASLAEDGGFTPKICGNHGLAGAGTQQTPADTQAGHDCCKFCAAGAPPILSGATIAVAPAPTFVTPLANPETASQGCSQASAHRPRGPPALG
ncbi:MAG: hypothetical protein HZB40_08470 [Rhodocyclales bacterium]|nr:hypothetical protein [Rhodocyclales bacterium]